MKEIRRGITRNHEEITIWAINPATDPKQQKIKIQMTKYLKINVKKLYKPSDRPQTAIYNK